MGLVTFVVLMAVEFAFGGLALGRSNSEQLATYRSAAGAIGLAAQGVCGYLSDHADLATLTTIVSLVCLFTMRPRASS